MNLRELVRLALAGGPGFLQLAVTNACNARCRFCSFPQVPQADWCMADPDRLARGLEAMHRAGIKYVCYTGGEPLLYPDLLDSLAQARNLGLETLLVTNGALLTPDLIQSLSNVGLQTLIISIDAASGEAHDRHRGVPGLTSHLKEILPLITEVNLKALASVTLSRLIDDLDALVDFVRDLGFTRLTFSYPLTWLSSSYLGFADNHLVSFSPEELDQWFSQILDLKKHSPLVILNPRLAVEEARRQLRGLPSRFPCLAGFKYFFADWRLEVYRCHFLADTLGPLEEIDRITPVRDGCNACSIDCYRDPSVFQYVAVSLADTLTAWRQGEVIRGFKSLLNPQNFLSLHSLMEGRHWLQ
ncbi:MAG: radical SAM protein [Syntrophobacterales bacterium]|jgi:MoaA/NifB/PqqE/SkfB family radical SAM enzyme